MAKVLNHIRISVRLCLISVNEMRDFYLHAYGYFDRRIRELEKKGNKKNDPESGEIIAEEIGELREHKNNSGYFAVVMMFSAFQRFLEELRDLTLDLAAVPELREVILPSSQKNPSLEDFNSFFSRLGISLQNAPYDWAKLIRLRDYRNAIVHQSGWVTGINRKRLSTYGHKLGEKLDVLDFVDEAGRLVDETADQLGKNYLDVIRGKGL